VLVAIGLVTQLGIQSGRIESGDVMVFPKTATQLLELTHAHAFTMAVIFLVLAHLFAATSVPEPVKRPC